MTRTSINRRGLGLALAGIAAAWAAGALAQSPAATTTPTPGFSSKQVLVAPISGVEGK